MCGRNNFYLDNDFCKNSGKNAEDRGSRGKNAVAFISMSLCAMHLSVSSSPKGLTLSRDMCTLS